jgi:hypothetical protein
MDLNITFLDWAEMIDSLQDLVMTESVVVLVTIELAEVTVKMRYSET